MARVPAALTLGLALLGAGRAGLAFPRPGEQQSASAVVEPLSAAALRAIRALHDPEAPPQEELVLRVEAAGGLPVDDLLRFLELGRIDAFVGEGDDFDPMDGEEQLMNRYQERLILALLDRAGAATVDAAVERQLARSEAPASVAAAILASGAVWEANRLRSLFELALPLEEPNGVDPRVERALEKGVASVLKDDPRGFETLAANWRHLPPPLLPAVVRAVGATADGRGVELLGHVITWEPELAALAVAQLRRLGPSPDPDTNARIAAGLRERLDPLETTFTRAALLALAELEDFESVPQLLDLLESAPVCRENALWALQRLVGRDWADSPGWWRGWYEDELEWHESSWPRMSRELRESIKREKQISILRAYGGRRLYRHDLAHEVAEFLRGCTDRRACLVAIDTLAQLGSREGIAILVEFLDRPDAELAALALRALHVITGETHPADSPEWSRWVRP